MRKFVAILLGAILVVTQVAAQNKTIKGRVTEDGKKPLSNASIIVKGTTVAAKTNEEGYYSITIPVNGRVLKFSSLNFEDQKKLQDELEASIESQIAVFKRAVELQNQFLGKLAQINSKIVAAQEGVINAQTKIFGKNE